MENERPQTVFDLLRLDDRTLARVIETRRADAAERFDLCRRVGAILKHARRDVRGWTIGDLSVETGVSPRILWVLEEGALETGSVPEDAVEAAAKALGLDPDGVFRDAAAADVVASQALEDPINRALVARLLGHRAVEVHAHVVPVHVRSGLLHAGPAPEFAYARLVAEAVDGSVRCAAYLDSSGSAELELPAASEVWVYLV